MGEIIAAVIEQHVAEPAADHHAERAIDQQIVDAVDGRPPQAAPKLVAADDPADQRPPRDQPADIGERVPANRQRTPFDENGVNRGKGQYKKGHSYV